VFGEKVCIESSGSARDSMEEHSAKSRVSLFAVGMIGEKQGFTFRR
jgi:hypothetical protein